MKYTAYEINWFYTRDIAKTNLILKFLKKHFKHQIVILKNNNKLINVKHMLFI